ncbi:MAG: hypothetical protein ACI311_05715 [Bacilli bacterium]
MFENIKIINECKKILKKHNIKYDEDFRIYKKLGFIHCQVDDWRGHIEVDGFPVLSSKTAIAIIVESCAFKYFLEEEKNKRAMLKNHYPLEYGEYEPRKYLFENTLNVLKDFNEQYYNKAINKYIKYLNLNKTNKQKWLFDKKTGLFEMSQTITFSAVLINKSSSFVQIYNQDPCGGRLGDNFYTFLSQDSNEQFSTFVFTNTGDDRFYLYVYNPKHIDYSDSYIMINKADKVVWTYFLNDNKKSKQERVFIFDGSTLNITGEINI